MTLAERIGDWSLAHPEEVLATLAGIGFCAGGFAVEGTVTALIVGGLFGGMTYVLMQAGRIVECHHRKH